MRQGVDVLGIFGKYLAEKLAPAFHIKFSDMFQCLLHQRCDFIFGYFFKHIFVNRGVPYLFIDQDEDDWMSRHFFSGGMMPSDDLPLHFQANLKLQRQWRWQGEHYEKTSNAWLQNMDDNKDALWPLLEAAYGTGQAQKWWMRWRMFFMACAELFAFNNGQEWYVSHYLFGKK